MRLNNSKNTKNEIKIEVTKILKRERELKKVSNIKEKKKRKSKAPIKN